jgi:hypothetical protein
MNYYFKASLATAQITARQRRFEDVAGYLVIARHASGLPVSRYDAYTLSGAGINGIHEKAGVSEETARGVIERLQGLAVIAPASPDATQAFPRARWEVSQGELDLDLPHALVDRGKVGAADSPLRRIKNAPLETSDPEDLKGVGDTELRLDALMLLLGVYRHSDMEAFGGLDPRCAYRPWDIKSQVQESRAVRWGAEPGQWSAYTPFMRECLQHANGKKALPDEKLWKRFWNAWHILMNAGLIYEAVTLFDTLPEGQSNARARYTIRVNDYHAGSVTKKGDPSLLRELEGAAGTKLAFYTPTSNDRGEPEAMRVMLPGARGALVGIWRPRFRAANPDAGSWIQRENESIGPAVRQLVDSQVGQV